MALLPEAVTVGTTGLIADTNQAHSKLNAYIDVQADFGAVGDGSTDDTVAINNALAAVPITGGEVYLPPGAYKISSPLLVQAHSTVLRGAGTGQRNGATQNAVGSRIEVAAGFTGAQAILVETSTGSVDSVPLYGATLRDFTLDGGLVGTDIDGIVIKSNRSFCEHVHVHRMSGDGFVWRTYATWDAYDSHIAFCQAGDNVGSGVLFDEGGTDCHLISCVLFNNGHNIQLLAGGSAQITSCHTYDAVVHNIFFNGSGSRTKIVGCKIEGAGQHGINIDSTTLGYSDIQIVGNNISTNGDDTNNTYDHIIIQGPSANGVSRTTIVGNTFTYKSSATPNKPRYGVNFASSASQFAVVTGNAFGPASHFGTAPVNGVGSGSSPALIRHNGGFVTESNGTATVTSGTTSIAVTHGLGKTPGLDDIQVTPTNSLGNASKFWISGATSTQFTINVNSDPGATTATFAWSASIL